MRSTLLTVTLALLFLRPHLVSAQESWWSPVVTPTAQLIYPSVTEIRVTPSVPRVVGMPVIPAPAPSATIAPRVTPVADPPPRIEIRRLYLPAPFYRPAWVLNRRPCGTGGWTR